MKIEKGTQKDLETILELQKLAFQYEAELFNDYTIQPLTQSYEEILEEFNSTVFFKATIDGKIIGSVRGSLDDGVCHIGKLMVHPDFQNRGIGKKLMSEIENYFSEAEKYRIYAGQKNDKNIRLYENLGYQIYDQGNIGDNTILVFMHKTNKK